MRIYDNLLSPYKDFSIINSKIEEIDIDIYEMLIGAKLPSFSANYPLLVDSTNRNLGVK